MFKRLQNNRGVILTAAIAGLTAAGLSATAAAVTAGAGLAGLGAFAVNKFTKSKNTPQIQGQSKAAEPSYDRASALAQGEADDKRRSIARNKTQYTTPQGLTPTDQSSLNLKTLTGA